MNILITGGAGYIGSHITEQLISKSNKIIIFDNLETGHERLINKKSIFVKGDIKDKKILSNIFKKIRNRYDYTSRSIFECKRS